jgi:copper oxidase (laccase) domain-containing protein
MRTTIGNTKLATTRPHPDPSKEFFAMRDVLAAQLGAVSVKRNQITVNSSCTYCDSKYYSYRRDKDGKRQNQSFVYIKPPLY